MMAWPAQRDAVRKLMAKLWELSERLHVVRVHPALTVMAARLACVVVAAFHIPRPSEAKMPATRVRESVLPLIVSRAGQGRVLPKYGRQLFLGRLRYDLALVALRYFRATLKRLRASALVVASDELQRDASAISVVAAVPLGYARLLAATASAQPVHDTYFIRVAA